VNKIFQLSFVSSCEQIVWSRYEKVTVFHSWNANWLFTNSIIFSLQRHSDHHENAHKPYQKLENIPQAPQLPASYPAVMLLALLPGLFFDVMDPRAMRMADQEGGTQRVDRRMKA
jgi:alkane 1-monooxygenase